MTKDLIESIEEAQSKLQEAAPEAAKYILEHYTGLKGSPYQS